MDDKPLLIFVGVVVATTFLALSFAFGWRYAIASYQSCRAVASIEVCVRHVGLEEGK